MNDFLSRFKIEDHKIAGFGYNRKSLLHGHGIYTALDIYKLKSINIKGIGVTNMNNLFGWQRSVVTQFVYRPDLQDTNSQMQKAAIIFNGKASQIKILIRQQYQSLFEGGEQMKYQKQYLYQKVCQMSELLSQAEYDLRRFNESI